MISSDENSSAQSLHSDEVLALERFDKFAPDTARRVYYRIDKALDGSLVFISAKHKDDTHSNHVLAYVKDQVVQLYWQWEISYK